MALLLSIRLTASNKISVPGCGAALEYGNTKDRRSTVSIMKTKMRTCESRRHEVFKKMVYVQLAGIDQSLRDVVFWQLPRSSNL